jgi:hypothetical protein
MEWMNFTGHFFGPLYERVLTNDNMKVVIEGNIVRYIVGSSVKKLTGI